MNRKDNSLKKDNCPNSFVKHEVEEFIYKLCNSNDPKLQEMGHRHKQELIDKQKNLNMLKDT
jgi:hypothetical protein